MTFTYDRVPSQYEINLDCFEIELILNIMKIKSLFLNFQYKNPFWFVHRECKNNYFYSYIFLFESDIFKLDKNKENILTTFDRIKTEANDDLKVYGKQQVIAAIKDFIFSRTVFKYNYCDIVQYLLCCVYFRRRISVKRNLSLRNHSYYRVGEEKLTEELD